MKPARIAAVASVVTSVLAASLARGGPPARPAHRAAPAASAAAPRGDVLAQARRGVVVVERAGQPLAAAVVLASDGRVLTALSPLGDAGALDVRHADGTVAHARLVHADPGWDLALLAPDVARPEVGLAASEEDPLRAGARLVAFAAERGRAAAVPFALRGREARLAADEKTVSDVLAIAGKVVAQEVGAPVLDDRGAVAALLTRACPAPGAGACAPIAVPVAAIRAFLAAAPVADARPAAFLGIQGVGDATEIVRGVRVQGVKPKSPADVAHIRAAEPRERTDWIVAVDGVPVPTSDALATAIASRRAGERVRLLVFQAGRFREVPVVLGATPRAAEPSGEEPAPARD